MEVSWYSRSEPNKQAATELFIIQPEAGARSPQRALKAIHRDRKIQELKERFWYKEN